MPALKAKPFASGERLVNISELPEWTQPAFKGMKELNRIQVSDFFPLLFSVFFQVHFCIACCLAQRHLFLIQVAFFSSF